MIKLMLHAPLYRPAGPRCSRPEDKPRPVSMAGIDPDECRGDKNGDELDSGRFKAHSVAVCPARASTQRPSGRHRKSFLKSAQAGSASVKPMTTIRQNRIERLERECLRDIGELNVVGSPIGIDPIEASSRMITLRASATGTMVGHARS